ncbi:MAG: MATE family efflux transporter, partial [Bacillota bacterium]|nr:MATE family efflux transporter [Bacillota bacterium]
MLFKKKQEVPRTYIFEEMSPTRAVLALGIPTVINQLINVIYNLADTFFVGRLDNPSMVAALSISAPVMITLSGFANLFVVGGCALISKALGAKDMKKAQDIATLCPVMALIVGALVSIFSGLFLDKLVILAGATDTCIEYTREYLKWVFCISAIPNIVGITLGGGLRGRGYSKFEMIGITSGNILNIILDPIFVFTLGMGVKGAAVATFISNSFSCLLFIIFAIYFQNKEQIYTIKGFRFDFKLAKEVIFTGFPAALHLFLGSIANVCFMNMVKVYSDACIAGVGIVRKLEHVSGQIVIGLNQGIIPLVSYNYGNKNFDRMTKVRKKALFITTCFGILAVIILLPFSTQFVKLFINDAETV